MFVEGRVAMDWAFPDTEYPGMFVEGRVATDWAYPDTEYQTHVSMS